MNKKKFIKEYKYLLSHGYKKHTACMCALGVACGSSEIYNAITKKCSLAWNRR